ncbi:unnamed protein product [Moneuplotes crassus]|uniref:Uncharacterized protein n=1 Tax=Euplotes crassus TaxID=5936 RepID=A0AAD1UJX0_EUPCR|nr:unnamed protein product [Moneuplotes crassus]
MNIARSPRTSKPSFQSYRSLRPDDFQQVKKQSTGLVAPNQGDSSISYILEESIDEEKQCARNPQQLKIHKKYNRKRISIIDSDVPTNMSIYGNTQESENKTVEKSPFNIKCSTLSSEKDSSQDGCDGDSVTLFNALMDSQSCLSGTRLSMITPEDISILKTPKASPKIITPFMGMFKKTLKKSQRLQKQRIDQCSPTKSYFTLSNCTPRGFTITNTAPDFQIKL